MSDIHDKIKKAFFSAKHLGRDVKITLCKPASGSISGKVIRAEIQHPLYVRSRIIIKEDHGTNSDIGIEHSIPLRLIDDFEWI
ncbi:hypothetical protein ACFLQI_02795 [Candidatus Undinarchaeota archaeon]